MVLKADEKSKNDNLACLLELLKCSHLKFRFKVSTEKLSPFSRSMCKKPPGVKLCTYSADQTAKYIFESSVTLKNTHGKIRVSGG